jgi:hypothetical protein
MIARHAPQPFWVEFSRRLSLYFDRARVNGFYSIVVA